MLIPTSQNSLEGGAGSLRFMSLRWLLKATKLLLGLLDNAVFIFQALIDAKHLYHLQLCVG